MIESCTDSTTVPNELRDPLLVTSIDQLIEELKRATLNAKLLQRHLQCGTVDDLADQMSLRFVEAAMMIPLVRNAQDLTPEDDVEDLVDAIAMIAMHISRYTNIPLEAVQRRVDRIAKQFPITDLQQSTYLRYTNQLH